MSLGLYIHIPFCKRRCNYCDFYLTTNLNLINSFAESLSKEIKIYSKLHQSDVIDTIFLGGGTPSAMNSNILENVLSQIKNSFNVCENPEITIECNPEDVIESKDKFLKISRTGVNRISIGIQSFIDAELEYLTRHHNSSEAEESVNILKDLFENVSIDIIYALHNQSESDIEYNLEKISRLDLKHVSAYSLILEKGTLLYKQMEKSDKIKQVDKKAEKFYFQISNTLRNMGYEHYEVSNYAKQGYQSRHNLKYWNFENYLGLGPSAHSFINNRRFSNVRNLKLYNNMLLNCTLPVEEDKLLNKEQLQNDYFISVFRSNGVEFAKFKKIFNEEFIAKYKKEVSELLDLKLADLSSTHFFLTLNGLALADEITLKFIN